MALVSMGSSIYEFIVTCSMEKQKEKRKKKYILPLAVHNTGHYIANLSSDTKKLPHIQRCCQQCIDLVPGRSGPTLV